MLHRLGYCCINTELNKKGIFMSRTCRLSTLEKFDTSQKAINYCKSLAMDNLKDLQIILKWNNENNMKVFRLSSAIFPFSTHPDYSYSLDDFKDILKSIGNYALKNNMRLTSHPDQFNVIGSDKEYVVKNSIRQLNFHSDCFEIMGLTKDSVMVIHGGGKIGGKENSMLRFQTNFKKLKLTTQKRIVLENCETSFSVEDLLPTCELLGIPLVMDFHHHNLNSGKNEISILIKMVIQTWEKRNIRPKFHLSETCPEYLDSTSLTKLRKHSDLITINHYKNTIKIIPENLEFDLMLECKLKEQAIFLLRA